MQIEDVILKYSNRGMNKLRPYLTLDFCHQAAMKILKQFQLEKQKAYRQNAKTVKRPKIILTTGFYVNGFAETDGPPGIFVLAKVLERLGYEPVIVTDVYCKGFFEAENWQVFYMDFEPQVNIFDDLLDQLSPVCLISVERCGANTCGDYANMGRISIRKYTAPVDKLFQIARQRHILTIGIGDGGNEIGMGNLQTLITKHLSLKPCVICVDALIIATVSNWGAYGLAACLLQINHNAQKPDMQKLTAQSPQMMPDWHTVEVFIHHIVNQGCVDGVSGQQKFFVDGFDLNTEAEIYNLCVGLSGF